MCNNENREDRGIPPQLKAPDTMLLLPFIRKEVPFTAEEEADAAHKLAVYYESCVEDEQTQRTYREIAGKKSDKKFTEAEMCLEYWHTAATLAESNYRRAHALSPENEKFREGKEYADQCVLRKQIKKALEEEPDNEAYLEMAKEFSIERRELFLEL